jgi:hypothetical protein
MICKRQFYAGSYQSSEFTVCVVCADSRLSLYQEFRIYLWAVGTKWSPESNWPEDVYVSLCCYQDPEGKNLAMYLWHSQSQSGKH